MSAAGSELSGVAALAPALLEPQETLVVVYMSEALIPGMPGTPSGPDLSKLKPPPKTF
jgi:hypothetical protein